MEERRYVYADYGVRAQDPFLTGRLATAFVRGLQGNDSAYIKASVLMRSRP